MGVGRRLLLLCIALVVGVAALESVASVILYRFYAHKKSDFYPYGTATVFLLRKAFHIQPPLSFSADNTDMFRADPVLGYTFNPGVYRILEKYGNGELHAFKVTILNDGSRATSVLQNVGAPRIYLMGNSGIWGFGIDDEMTIAWMLQTHVPEFHVLNLAVTAYTTVQSLLQFRAIENQLTQSDIMVFSYWTASQHYNVGDRYESFGHDFELALTKSPDFDKLQLPFGYLSRAGDLGIRYLSLDCAAHLTACSPGPDKIADARKVTEAIFEEILKQHRCHIVVAFFEGEDDDPIIALLRSSGVPVADLRFPKSAVDANDFTPAHDHVGAFANHARFEDLLQALLTNGLIPTRVTNPGKQE